jgi:metallophosphoesterase superfamily enzyme
MPQAIAHGGQPSDRPVEFLCLGHEHPTIDAWPAVRCEHPGNLLEREAGLTPKGYQCEPIEDRRTK